MRSIEPFRRPVLIAALTAANLLCAASIARTLHNRGKLYPGYAVELARGLVKYGPAGVFVDPPIQPVSLRVAADGRRLD